MSKITTIEGRKRQLPIPGFLPVANLLRIGTTAHLTQEQVEKVRAHEPILGVIQSNDIVAVQPWELGSAQTSLRGTLITLATGESVATTDKYDTLIDRLRILLTEPSY